MSSGGIEKGPVVVLLSRYLALHLIAVLLVWETANGATEFCLQGKLDLGVRYQGMNPRPGEFYPTSWCVVTERDSSRVLYQAAGKSNPDMDDDWTVAYLPPEMVRIVNRESPPDVEFNGTDNLGEALAVRRIDPQRLFEEYESSPDSLQDVAIETRGERVLSAVMSVDMPLRGTVSVKWNWDWKVPSRPQLRLIVDDELLFEATGSWRTISDENAADYWQATAEFDPIEAPGSAWPTKINMRVLDLAEGVYLVRGVRTGFQHFVVDTKEGLVIGDAPAGWVQFHHIPPSDLVRELGVSGLSERFIDFLDEQFPDRPILAVALTHFHDDHAGGARAFASVGADIYSTKESAQFLEDALNRPSMPIDRLRSKGSTATVLPVTNPLTLGSAPNRVRLVPLGANPHSDAMLGVWAIDKNYFFVSDIHVPRSEAEKPPEHRVDTECWFAGWAVKNLSNDVRIVNSHSGTVTPVSRLQKYLDSDLC